VAGEDVGGVVGFARRKLEDHPYHERDGPRERRQHHDADTHRRGYGQGDTVGVGQGERLGQHLGEDHDEHGHPRGRIDDTGIAENADQQARRQRRGENVHEIVAEQNRADQALRLGEQPIDLVRINSSFLLQREHSGSRDGRESGLGAAEERR
jgi:hypothetical protein